MIDDDLDLDLAMDDDDDEPPKRPKPVGPRAVAAAAKPAPVAAKGAPVLPATKPGLVARVFAPVCGLFQRCHLPVWNARNFGLGLLILVLVLLVVENWPPMRLNCLGLHCDMPKAVVLVALFVLGFGVAWLILRKRGAPAQQ